MNMRNLSLFTGSGIGDYAAEQCGIETVAQCENDQACLYCLERLFPHAKQFKDVRDVSVESLRELLPIDIISGGFPCQDISTAGRGDGIEGSRSGLWREMFRIIRQVRPTWLLIENVPSIRVRGVDRVIAPLERIGYTCWPLVVGVAACGGDVPRERLWLVARAVGLGLQSWELHETRLQDLQNTRPPVRKHPDGGGDHSRQTRSEAFASFPVETDGVAGGLLPATRKALLRMAGNGWCYTIPKMIYQWIMEVERDNAKR